MKLLMLTDKMGLGGAETHILTLIRALIPRGYDITLISSGGVYEKELRRLGVKCIYAPLDKRTLQHIKKSSDIIGAQLGNFRLVHAHTRLTAYLAVRQRGKSSTPKIVTTAHLNFDPGGVGRLTKWGDITLAVSEDIREQLIKEYKIPAENIILTENGIEMSDFPHHAGQEKRIIHVSRIDKGRSLVAFLLCDIAQRLASEFPDYKIEIVGEGNLFNKLRERALAVNRRLGREYIILRGGRSDIPKILDGGGIFVGVSRAALEAMSAGLAVIIGGDEGYGSIISSKNLHSLRKTNLCARGLPTPSGNRLFSDIKKIIESPRLKSELEAFSSDTVKRYYSADKMCEDAAMAYSRALSASPPGRVAILGYIGYGNLGDEAALKSCLRLLRNCGITSISVLTADTRCSYEGAVPVNRYNPLAVMRLLKGSDALILCGGNLLQNETSTRSLLYYCGIMRLAAGLGAKIYMLSSGIGGLYGRLAHRVAGSALSLCHTVGLRTERDRLTATDLGIHNSIYMPDLCFMNDFSQDKGDGEYALIIAKSRDFIKRVHSVLAPLKIPIKVTAIYNREDRDRVLSASASLGLEFIKASDEAELTELLYHAKFVISERLHGGIFSLLCGVVCFLNGESEKCLAMIEEAERVSKILGIDSSLFEFTEENLRVYANTAEKEKGAEAKGFGSLGICNYFKRELSLRISELFS